jgi:hypothetical protein
VDGLRLVEPRQAPLLVVPVASDAAREPQTLPPCARRPRCPWPEPMEETMRVFVELSPRTKTEFAALLRQIAAELPHLAEGSTELRNAHINLQGAGEA